MPNTNAGFSTPGIVYGHIMNSTIPPPTASRVGLTLTPAERRILDAAAAERFIAPSTLARVLVLDALRSKPAA